MEVLQYKLKNEGSFWTINNGNFFVTYYPLTDMLIVHSMIPADMLTDIILIIKLRQLHEKTNQSEGFQQTDETD